MERCRELVQYAFVDSFNAVCIANLAQDEYKLIPAKAGNSVGFAHAIQKTLSRLLQQYIALGMTQSVIDLLEVIEIEKHHCKRQRSSMGLFHFLLQAVEKHARIGQAGQVIKVGLLPYLLFGLLFLGDIGEQRDSVMYLSFVTKNGVDGQPFGINLTVFASIPYFTCPLAAGVDFVPHGLKEISVVVA